LQKGDTFLLCSDGLHQYFENNEINTYLSYDAQEACQKLVEAAKQRGGSDNITVQVIKVTGGRKLPANMSSSHKKPFVPWIAGILSGFILGFSLLWVLNYVHQKEKIASELQEKKNEAGLISLLYNEFKSNQSLSPDQDKYTKFLAAVLKANNLKDLDLQMYSFPAIVDSTRIVYNIPENSIYFFAPDTLELAKKTDDIYAFILTSIVKAEGLDTLSVSSVEPAFITNALLLLTNYTKTIKNPGFNEIQIRESLLSFEADPAKIQFTEIRKSTKTQTDKDLLKNGEKSLRKK
jgi:hypothetical protein